MTDETLPRLERSATICADDHDKFVAATARRGDFRPLQEVAIRGKNSTSLLNLGNSLEYMQAMAPRSVSLICTSPPYNLGVPYENYDDSIPRSDYLSWTDSWLTSAMRVLADDGHLFLNMGAKPSNPYGPDQVFAVACQVGWSLQNRIYWAKSVTAKVTTKAELIAQAAERTGLDKETTRKLQRSFREIEGDGLERTFGHFKPLNTNRYLNDCVEQVFHFTKTGNVAIDRKAIGAPYEYAGNIGRWSHTGGENLRCRGNLWVVGYETIQSRAAERASHPATFPVELAEMCLKLAGGRDKISVAMDPFSGTGSTAVACARLGINCLSVELGPAAHMEAVRRVKEILA